MFKKVLKELVWGIFYLALISSCTALSLIIPNLYRGEVKNVGQAISLVNSKIPESVKTYLTGTASSLKYEKQDISFIGKGQIPEFCATDDEVNYSLSNKKIYTQLNVTNSSSNPAVIEVTLKNGTILYLLVEPKKRGKIKITDAVLQTTLVLGTKRHP